MAAGDIKLVYAASSNLTVTALDGLAASSTWVAGWQSDVIDNTSNLYEDFRVTAKLTAESAGLAAGEIRMYLVGPLDDTTWPDTITGAGQAAKTITDTEIRDAICKWGASTATDTTASRVYYLDCESAKAVFRGFLPKKFIIFITQSTGTTLETTGNQVTVSATYRNVAA